MSILVVGRGRLGKNFINKSKKIKVLSKNECNIELSKDVITSIEKYKPSSIINTAAITSMSLCEKYKKNAWLTNVYGASNIVRIANRYSIYTVQISSDNAIRPINEYGYTKQASEKLGFDSVIRLNYFCKDHWLIKKIIKKQNVELLTSNKFNPLFIDTVTNTILKIIKNNIGGVINLGTTDCLSYYDFGKKLSKKLKKEDILIKKIKKLETPFTYKYSSCMSINTLKQKLGLTFSMDKEIEKYVNSIKK